MVISFVRIGQSVVAVAAKEGPDIEDLTGVVSVMPISSKHAAHILMRGAFSKMRLALVSTIAARAILIHQAFRPTNLSCRRNVLH